MTTHLYCEFWCHVSTHLPQISVTSLNATKCLAVQLLVHLSTSQTALRNVGHCEVEQGLFVQIWDVLPDEQPNKNKHQMTDVLNHHALYLPQVSIHCSNVVNLLLLPSHPPYGNSSQWLDVEL